MSFIDFIYDLARELEDPDQTAAKALRKIVKRYDKKLRLSAKDKPVDPYYKMNRDDEIPF